MICGRLRRKCTAIIMTRNFHRLLKYCKYRLEIDACSHIFAFILLSLVQFLLNATHTHTKTRATISLHSQETRSSIRCGVLFEVIHDYFEWQIKCDRNKTNQTRQSFHCGSFVRRRKINRKRISFNKHPNPSFDSIYLTLLLYYKINTVPKGLSDECALYG